MSITQSNGIKKPLKWGKFSFLAGMFLFFFAPGMMSAAKNDYSIVKESVSAQKGPSAPQKRLRYYLLAFHPERPGEKFPLLVVLHNSGSTAKGYLKLWEEASALRRVMVAAPVLNRPYQNDPEDLEPFRRLLIQIRGKYPVDKDKIFLIGTSAGGLVAQWLMIHDPAAWRGVVLIAAPPNPDLIRGLDPGNAPPFFWLHGEKDPLFRYGEVLELFKRLRQKQVPGELWPDPQAAHEHKPEWHAVIWEWIRKTGG